MNSFLSIALMALLALALAACTAVGGNPGQSDTSGEGITTGSDGTTNERSVTPKPQDTPSPGLYQQPYPYGGMMGSGMMGGMMGGWGGRYNSNGQPLTLEQATESVSRFLNSYGGGLELKEVMEFDQNFYAEVEEKSTGIHAVELLVNKYTGQVSPEMGPNVMWNTKYGMMNQMMGSYYRGGSPTVEMPITPEQARSLAQRFLDANRPGLQAGESDTFYGYYTLHTLKNDRIEGMLSVNGYNGQVWYHTWHGPFVRMTEVES